MIARLFIQLPFHIMLPEGEKYQIVGYEVMGYMVHIYPPVRSDQAPPIKDSDQMRINGVVAFQADTLRLDFSKDSFDLRASIDCDPPLQIIERVANEFLIKLRYVTRAFQIHSIDIGNVSWRLDYINDDETELDPGLGTNEKLVRGRGRILHSLSWISITKDVWENIFRLEPNYEPPPWDALILDAYDELPSIGSSVVLAATALEVFISKILDDLAIMNELSSDIWGWINERRREPSLEEQFSDLLRILSNHSLKDENKLWESFLDLKDARNSFVHGGIAAIRKVPINSQNAYELVTSATQIISKIKEWLPENMHWPEFKHELKFQWTKKLN